ncbi:choice-of-anchor L domain-containing protein [Brumimicrobium aurantiacum]|uniref:PKD domain-containing protein n=1 Tax=Brumimicrobium aurantiacum TaxID=1737063 RepID=A0A3E1EY28_9FLAO|nr:choice-of-anchor L domain-containing protein [Brumimicrobium aurantiacum]RFC54373.1 hypothetical protein DXU93_08065 [Brumimicrobium aurantiacum]
MKNYTCLSTVVKLFSFLFAFLLSNSLMGQITLTNPNITPAYAVNDVLLGAGVTATNITYNGSPLDAQNPQASVIEFANTSPVFPLDSGVLLQTSGAPNIIDPDLSAITTNNVTNGTIIEFDFIPDGDSLSFNYIFSSVEYQGYTCSNYNDVFGFFISGPGISGPYTNNAKNIAVVPGTTNIPVGINSVNSGSPSFGGSAANCAAVDPNWTSNSVYFTQSYNTLFSNSSLPGFSSFNGSTVELTANTSVICGQTYHIKLAISNVMDTGFDSGVFLKAGSFASEPAFQLSASNLTSTFSDSVIVESCHTGTFCFDRTAAQNSNQAVVYFQTSGTATRGVDYNLTNTQNSGDSVVLGIGVNSVCLNVVPIDDGITEGPENVEIVAYSVNPCGDTTFSTGEIWIADSPVDLVPNAGNDTVICNGGQGTLNGASTISSNEILWTYSGPGNVTFTPDDQTLNADVAFDTPGQYIMYLTESNDSCNTQVMDSIIVDYEEVTLGVTNDTTICENGTATMVATGSGSSSFVYNWSHSSDLNGTQVITPTNQDTYSVFAESVLGCLTDTLDIEVDVLPEITLVTSDSSTICPGENIKITASASGGDGGPYNYVWTDDNGVTVGNGDLIDVSPSVTTTYTVEVTDGCESTPKSSTVEVVVAGLPDIVFDVVDGEICTPAEFVLFNQTADSLVNETYWNISNGMTFMDNDTIEVNIENQGTYDVQMVVVTPEGCVDSASVNEMLRVYPKPSADFTFFPMPATILNPNVTFQNESVNGYSYEWNFEEGDPIFATSVNPTSTFPNDKTGEYEVELITTSEHGCKDTSTNIVEVIPDVTIFAPNSFTPNGDELNPTWKPMIQGVDNMNVTIEIYNRWGEKVWESHDLNVGWDGTYGSGNIIVPAGVYVWKVKASNMINDDKYVWDGVLNVIK